MAQCLHNFATGLGSSAGVELVHDLVHTELCTTRSGSSIVRQMNLLACEDILRQSITQFQVRKGA